MRNLRIGNATEFLILSVSTGSSPFVGRTTTWHTCFKCRLPGTPALTPVHALTGLILLLLKRASRIHSSLHSIQPTILEKPRAAKSCGILHSPNMILGRGVGGISRLNIYLFMSNKCHWSIGEAGYQ